MSYTPPPVQPHHFAPLPEPSKPSKRRRILTGLALVATLAVGVGIGSAGSADSEPEAASVAPEATEVQTVAQAPEACLRALDAADAVRHDAVKGFSLFLRTSRTNQQWPHLVLRAAQAGASLDTAEIQAITADMKGMAADTSKVNRKLDKLADRTSDDTDEYLSARDECRAAS